MPPRFQRRGAGGKRVQCACGDARRAFQRVYGNKVVLVEGSRGSVAA